MPPLSILNAEGGVVKKYYNIPPYNDEPKFYFLTAQLHLPDDIQQFAQTVGEGESLGTVGGASLEKIRALWKVTGEAVERYCLLPGGLPSTYRPFTSFRASKALDPNSISAGVTALEPDRHLLEIEWVRGYQVGDSQNTWVPSQLVFVPHIFRDKEAVLRAPITTGAAAGFSVEDAVYRGLCEVIERDAFMVAWLRQLCVPRLIPDPRLFQGNEGSLLHRTLEVSLRYHLEPVFLQLPTDAPVLTILCTLWDRSGVGPPVTVGAKTSWNLISAMLGALEEAYQIRPWMRRLLDESDASHNSKNPTEPLPRTLEERARLWLSRDSARHLSEWVVSCQDALDIGALLTGDKRVPLADLVHAIEQQQGTVYYVDLSAKVPASLKSSGIKVVKVIVPEYQPLYLTEELKDYSWSRLTSAEPRLAVKAFRSIENLTAFPHPFL